MLGRDELLLIRHIRWGEAPERLMIEPERLVASCLTVSIRLKTCRAVVNRWITASVLSGVFGARQNHQLLSFDGTVFQEPRPNQI
jgi:hypothetical protein